MVRYAGLTGAPDESGTKRREKGLAKARNDRVRRGMLQLAWRFLRFQEASALAQWYRGTHRRRARLDTQDHNRGTREETADDVLDNVARDALGWVLILSREGLRAPIRRASMGGGASISGSRQEQPGWEGGENGPAARDRPAAQPGGGL